jgi:septation ring formation regulator EzrA
MQQLEEWSSSTSASEQKISYLMSEVNSWKEKFKDMSSQYRNASEELTLRNAELDHIRSKQGGSSTTETKAGTDPRGSMARSSLKNVSNFNFTCRLEADNPL